MLSEIAGYQSVVLDYLKTHGKIQQDFECETGEDWESFLQFFDKSKVCILAEFGKLEDESQGKSISRIFLLDLLLDSEVKCVVSLSAAGGYYTETVTMDSSVVRLRLSDLHSTFKIVQLGRFSEDNVKKLLLLRQSSFDIDELWHYTNFNPRLVALCLSPRFKDNPMYHLNFLLDPLIRKFRRIVSYMVNHDKQRLSLCLKCLLISVAEGHDNEVSDEQFKICPLTIENILFKWENKISLAYPSIFQELKEMFMSNIMDYTSLLSASVWFNKTILGQRFEYHFSQFFEGKSLDLSVFTPISLPKAHQGKSSKARKTQIPTSIPIRTISLDIRFIEYQCIPLRKVAPGTLYMLRPFHPAIDAIFKHENTVYLIQLSVSKYNQHESKIESIYNIASAESKDQQIKEYYSTISNCSSCAYVYISPNEVDGNLLKQMSKLTNLQWQNDAVKFGTIEPKSSSATYINQVHSLLTTTRPS
jgi:hypothetical protein